MLKRRQNFFAQPFQEFFKFRVVRDLNGFAPFCAAPAAGERLIFQPVNLGFVHRRKTGLERGKPVIVRPVERDRAERAAGQFRQGVMRHEFPPVEKERNSVAAKRALQRFMIAVETAHEHGGIAKTPALADEAQNLARGKNSLGLGIGTGGNTEFIVWCWRICCLSQAGLPIAQLHFQLLQSRIVRETILCGSRSSNSTLTSQSGALARRWRHC